MGSHVRLMSAAVGAAMLVCFLTFPAQVAAQFGDGEVDVTGNVLLSPDASLPNYPVYYDNPFTPEDEGSIPENGNRIDPFTIPPAKQIEFEGRPDFVNNTNINFDIIVGRTSSGQLLLNGAQLRDQNLVIGDQGMIGALIRRGTGTMRIEGFGALYNNDPTILPYLGTDPATAVSPSAVPRATNVGFDMWVGRYGTGVLQLILGGQAEIQDAVIVGDQSGSIGSVLIDGFDSFLQSGGFQVTSTVPGVANYMIVGRLGSGTMSITNGGQSYNAGPIGTSGNVEQWGAVIGSNSAADDTAPPDVGGTGLVVVDGLLSKWTVAGNLQVGGFHNNRIGTGPLAVEDLEGELAIYGSGVGHGTLRVTNGGLVSIIPPPLDNTASNAPNRLDFLVGRFGRVELDGGRIELLGAIDNASPQNPMQELTRGRLINDGVVMGDGTISVLQFRNRVLGEVRVNAGQSLVIAATGNYTQTDNIPLPTEPEEYPLSNYGLIKVQGTPEALAQLEFQRNLSTDGPMTPTQTRPFLNLPLLPGPPGAPNGRTGGEIVASNSVMHFDSDIINRHKVTFDGGTNLVTGNFFNEGTVEVGGIDTSVTFVDQFFNTGTLQLEPGVSLMTFIDDLVFDPDDDGSGALNMSFASHIAGNETVNLGGTLNASLFAAPGFPGFVPLAGAQYEIIRAATALIGDFDTVNTPGCIQGICFVGIADATLNAYFIRSFDLNSPLVVGGDFDGSGLVDDVDFQIWRQNLGESGAPGLLPGDGNDDGVVDGTDFLIWQMQFGMPGSPPGAGAGSGSGGLNGNLAVPEPASVALFAVGGMLALALARRRAG